MKRFNYRISDRRELAECESVVKMMSELIDNTEGVEFSCVKFHEHGDNIRYTLIIDPVKLLKAPVLDGKEYWCREVRADGMPWSIYTPAIVLEHWGDYDVSDKCLWTGRMVDLLIEQYNTTIAIEEGDVYLKNYTETDDAEPLQVDDNASERFTVDVLVDVPPVVFNLLV